MKEKDLLTLKVHGIKCDHCPYNDMSVQPEEYDAWLNRPCPDCGENLLTQEDYDALRKMQEWTQKINAKFDKLPRFLKRLIQGKSNKTAHLPMELNGDGKLNIDTEGIYHTEDVKGE